MENFEIKRALEFMKNYINTYENQAGWEVYSEQIWIEDMLYGIGVSISEDFRFANGLDKFKSKLITEEYVK